MTYKDLCDLQFERGELLRSLVLGDESVKSRLDEVNSLIHEQVERDLEGLYGKPKLDD